VAADFDWKFLFTEELAQAMRIVLQTDFPASRLQIQSMACGSTVMQLLVVEAAAAAGPSPKAAAQVITDLVSLARRSERIKASLGAPGPTRHSQRTLDALARLDLSTVATVETLAGIDLGLSTLPPLPEPEADADGDGCSDAVDAFPEDPYRCLVVPIKIGDADDEEPHSHDEGGGPCEERAPSELLLFIGAGIFVIGCLVIAAVRLLVPARRPVSSDAEQADPRALLEPSKGLSRGFRGASLLPPRVPSVKWDGPPQLPQLTTVPESPDDVWLPDDGGGSGGANKGGYSSDYSSGDSGREDTWRDDLVGGGAIISRGR
jgi:hypothetical protein